MVQILKFRAAKIMLSVVRLMTCFTLTARGCFVLFDNQVAAINPDFRIVDSIVLDQTTKG